MKALLCCLLILAAHPAAAEDELDRLPDFATPAPAAAAATARRFVETAPGLAGLRSGLAVRFPPPAPPSWQDRTSLDWSERRQVGDRFTVTFSDRLNATAQDRGEFPSRTGVRNDLREAFATWQPDAGRYLEAGRINLRNGVALGFNPTDFFKTGSAVDQASLDPSVIRQNRLGTALAQAQALFDGGSVALAVAPKLASPARLAGDDHLGLDPRFDRTNGTDRLLLTASVDLADLAPQVLLLHEGRATHVGLNLSRGLGQSVVGYVEWAGGNEPDLVTRALDYGKARATLPAGTSNPLETGAGRRFRSDLDIGASWTSAAKVTVNLEYLYHEGGFSRQTWGRWFTVGQRIPALDRTLWLIRGYAAFRQEPVSQNQAFLRADWTDAFVRDLELTGFALVNTDDGSALAQLSASYPLSRDWTVSGYLSANLGGRRTEHGSLPQATGAVLQVRRYF